ncbi:sugar ABC transporter permease [Eubacteriales bacterium OttesenSCG-928-A19]|nr:sugar ABC transporter permease [Eubacteriales bacterium OttesenSCG-928-A19]
MRNKSLALSPDGQNRLRKWEGYAVSWLMILPAMIFLVVFVIYPALNMGFLSLFKGNAANPYKEMIGLDNYYRLFVVKTDFYNALKNTALYTLGALISIIFMALLFAQWMYKDRRINRLAQAVFFTPHLVAGVSAGFIWSWLMSSQSYGLFNTVLNTLGLPSVRWLDDSSTAMISIIIMNTWKSTGYYALILLSSMKSIPVEIYEAARLDNSSSIRTFFRITLPMISPQLFFLLITITTGSFKVFDSVRIMTNGGPGDSTRVLSMYIYDYAFQRNNTLGYACAAGVIMLLIMVAITVVDFAFVEKKVHYQ